MRPLRIAALLLAAAALAGLSTLAGAQSLYWIDTSYGAPTLNRASTDGLGVTSLALPAGTLPEGLAADGTGRVFWTEAAWSGARVQRVVSDLSHGATLVSGASVLRGIAIDQASQQLYWTSSNLATGAKVHRANVGGGIATDLIALSSAANPRGIAVDAAANQIFWADFDQNALYTASLDGTSPAVWLALAPGSAPYGVAVDPATHRVYWTEYGSGTLRRADPGGLNVTMIASGLANPTYVAYDAASARLFWTEGGAGLQRIRRANADGSALVTLPPPLATYGGIGVGSGSALSAPGDELPLEFALDRVWPTPGSGPLHVAFALPREARVRLAVLDLQGRVVKVLADEALPAGRHERRWSGSLASGRAPAGVYFVQLRAEQRTWVQRVVLTQ